LCSGTVSEPNEHGIFTLAAHLLGEQFGMGLAEALGRGEFEVPILVLDARTLMRHDLDAGLARLVENRLERLFVVGHHADHCDFLGDEVFDRPDLQRRVRAGRPDHRGVDAVLGALLLDAGLHGVEPGDAADLDDDAHGRLVGGVSPGPERQCERRARAKHSPCPQHAVPPS
jgi:hypothetical protein